METILIFAIFFTAIILLWHFSVNRKKYQNINYLKHLSEAERFLALVDNFSDYVTWKQRDKILAEFADVGKFFKFKTNFYKKELKVGRFNEIYQNFHSYIKNYNFNFVLKQKEMQQNYFDDIEGKQLDEQQRTAILTDEHSNLIIAGAGSGKTLTIIGKIKYLIEKKKIDASKILLLSFTKDTVYELNCRLQELKLQTSAVTFHKLGYGFVKKYIDKAPSVANDNDDLLPMTIKDFLEKDILSEKSALNSFVQFMACYMTILKSDDKFESLEEKIDVNKGIDLETLKSKIIEKTDHTTLSGERVKSTEELVIANFLFLNGIMYEYEKRYPHGDYPYHPDFYLLDYNIYLEHFGVDENGRAKWLSVEGEEKYLTEMQIKREKHKQYGTKLLETYSYYNKNNVLLDKLEELLKNEGVTFSPLSTEEIYEKIANKNKTIDEGLHKLICSFINLSKSRKMTAEKLQQHFKNRKADTNEFIYSRQNLFLNFALPILKKYDKELQKENKIDFNDMINMATDLIKTNGLCQKYDYIIIDEYQDISVARFELINEIRKQTDAKLVCVGDDWQSIYRFTGSDVSLFSNFGNFVGEYEMLLIERTYRNSQQLIDVSAKFIQQNEKQIKKNPVSQKNIECPIEIIKHGQHDKVLNLLNTIKHIVAEFGREKSILLLGRHRFDINEILEQDKKDIIKHYNKKTNHLEILGFEDVDIKFLTVHSAKGLEADNVIILNLKNDLYGFPNKLVDDPVLSLLLSEEETYQFAEERRLFYVALTRTKNKMYLFVPENKSLFVKEITKYSDYLAVDVKKNESLICPSCYNGFLVEQNGKNGKFLGCSNYPSCRQTYNNIEILNKPIVCPSCHNGFLVERNGKNGKFLGCTNYPKWKCTGKKHIYQSKNGD